MKPSWLMKKPNRRGQLPHKFLIHLFSAHLLLTCSCRCHWCASYCWMPWPQGCQSWGHLRSAPLTKDKREKKTINPFAVRVTKNRDQYKLNRKFSLTAIRQNDHTQLKRELWGRNQGVLQQTGELRDKQTSTFTKGKEKMERENLQGGGNCIITLHLAKKIQKERAWPGKKSPLL